MTIPAGSFVAANCNRLRVSTLICPQKECGWNAEHMYLLWEKPHFPFSSKADHRHRLTLYLYKTWQETWDVVLFKCGFLYQVQVGILLGNKWLLSNCDMSMFCAKCSRQAADNQSQSHLHLKPPH